MKPFVYSTASLFFNNGITLETRSSLSIFTDIITQGAGLSDREVEALFENARRLVKKVSA